METLQTQDGHFFIKSLAQFIRQHEKALANSLQLSIHRKQMSQNATTAAISPISPSTPASQTRSHGSLMSAFAHAGLNFSSYAVRSAHLTLTPHHLFYLLSRIEELGIAVGPMNVRTESLHIEPNQGNYVSFLQAPKIPKKGRSDADSIHSVSSVRSMVSLMGGFWSSIGLGSSSSKSEKTKAAIEADLKYLYSAFTKLPSLRLTSDHRAQLIKGYEEFPFDTAVPLFAFKNVQQLDIIDMDFRQFHGWDRMADQLTLLTVKRGHVEDVEDLLTNIVLDDAERRRRRSTRHANEPPSTPSWTMPSTPSTPLAHDARSDSDSGSPQSSLIFGSPVAKDQFVLQHDTADKVRQNSYSAAGTASPKRPTPSRPASSYRHVRTYSSRVKRTGSASSNSSDCMTTPQRSDSNLNLAGGCVLPASKWQRLKYLSLADNALTTISARSIAPIANSLRSLNLSSNLFNEIPDSLATLTRLSSLDLSNCMIDSLHTLIKCPLPAITTLKLKSNRLVSLAGIERLVSLENLHVQDNLLADPMEAARLTGMPNLRRIWFKQNPLTKRYHDYRITIINLFRQTPGYVDDIIIDDQPVTYTERKLLVPRVPELERPSTAANFRMIEAPVVVQHARPLSNQLTDQSTHASVQDASSTSNRRKRVPRRRIVDLAAKDNRQASRDTRTDEPSRLTIDTHLSSVPVSHSLMADADEIADPSEEMSKLGIAKEDSAATAGQSDDGPRGDYRVRIEALRQEFGSNWLSALGGQNVHADHHYANEVGQSQHSLHLGVNPVVVTGGRSLG